MAIHQSAVIHDAAELAPEVEIGPYCVIGPRVRIGAGTRLLSHVVIQNDTSIGCRNTIHPFASLGGTPQDLKYQGEPGRLIIGDENTIREGATVNIGTKATLETRVGSGCLLMAYSHVAHDCRLGDGVVLANSVGLAGHVEVGDRAILAGLAAVHQFCRIGRHAFVAGGGMASQDVPPFCIAQGDRAQLVGINIVGLRRSGWSRERIAVMRQAFRLLFKPGATRLTALDHVEQTLAKEHKDVLELCQFIRAAKRGLCPPRPEVPPADNFEANGEASFVQNHRTDRG